MWRNYCGSLTENYFPSLLRCDCRCPAGVFCVFYFLTGRAVRTVLFGFILPLPPCVYCRSLCSAFFCRTFLFSFSFFFLNFEDVQSSSKATHTADRPLLEWSGRSTTVMAEPYLVWAAVAKMYCRCCDTLCRVGISER